MSRYSRKIDRAAAERLLCGEPADPRQPDDLLAVLLATVAAPAHVGELAGEEAAVAAFRQARAADAACAVRSIDEAPATPRRPLESAPVRSWVRHPLRLALVALTVTTAGGTALAAGSITWSQGPAEQRPATASATPPRPAGGPGSGHAGRGSPASTPHPSIIGLCRAYTAGAGSAPGKALENPAFASLIEAAGGKSRVAGYCATVLATEAAKRQKKAKEHGKTSPPGQSDRQDPTRQDDPSDPAGQQGQQTESGLSGPPGGSDGAGQSDQQDQTRQDGTGGSGGTTASPSASATPLDTPSEQAIPQRTGSP